MPSPRRRFLASAAAAASVPVALAGCLDSRPTWLDRRIRWRAKLDDHPDSTVGDGGNPISSVRVFDGLVLAGTHEGQLTAFSADDGEVEWVAMTNTWSTPARLDDLIVVGARWQRAGVEALELATGERHWFHEVDDPEVRSSPAIEGDRIVITRRHGVLRLDTDGEERWFLEKTTGETEELGEDGTRYSSGGSPIVANGVSYQKYSRGSGFSAVDVASGELLWETETRRQEGGHSLKSRPTVDDRHVYFGVGDGTLYALDRETGETAWTYDTRAMTSDPALGDGAVYAVDDEVHDSELTARLHAVSTDGENLWETAVPGATNFDSPVFQDGTIYLGCSTVYAVDAETGEIEWEYEPDGGGMAAPAVADETVYAAAGDYVYALSA